MTVLEWVNYDIKDVLKIQKSYGYFFKCFMKSKGFTSRDRDRFFFLKDRPKEEILIDNFASLSIRYISWNDMSQEIFLHRYVMYPKILETLSTSVHIPNPFWGYGFLETMIEILGSFLLEDIINKKGVYDDLLKETNTYRQYIQTRPSRVITGSMIQEENKRMLEIPFTPKYLSYEKYLNKENPFKVESPPKRES